MKITKAKEVEDYTNAIIVFRSHEGVLYQLQESLSCNGWHWRCPFSPVDGFWSYIPTEHLPKGIISLDLEGYTKLLLKHGRLLFPGPQQAIEEVMACGHTVHLFKHMAPYAHFLVHGEDLEADPVEEDLEDEVGGEAAGAISDENRN